MQTIWIVQYFTSLITSIFNFFNCLDLFSSIMTRIPWRIVSVKSGVARKSCMPFYLKCRFCLFPKAKYIHLDTILLSFTSLMTNIFIFRFFEPFSLNYDQNILGYCFNERWCCQKIMPFLPKMPILLRPYKLKTYIYTFNIEVFSRPYFTNLMTFIFNFLMSGLFPPQVWSKHLGV